MIERLIFHGDCLLQGKIVKYRADCSVGTGWSCFICWMREVGCFSQGFEGDTNDK